MWVSNRSTLTLSTEANLGIPCQRCYGSWS